MIANRVSGSKTANPGVRKAARKRGQGNVAWLRQNLNGADPAGGILLLGGTGLTDFRLRVAQSHARNDLLPSFWSHAALVRGRSGKDAFGLWETSLEPARGFGFAPKDNGVQESDLSHYDDPERFPNIALIRFTMRENGAKTKTKGPGEALAKGVEALRRQRTVMDIGAYIVDWLAFAWGVADKGNPLLKGIGVPGAVMVESACSIAGLELTPGLASQASCPEAIWQSVKWWHSFYESEASVTAQAPDCLFSVGQEAAAVVD
jgi:hypothetical protein